MPRYAFKCTQCDVEFEVSRPMSRAGEAAECPSDGAEAERVFYMPMTGTRSNMAGPPSAIPGAPPVARGHGHSHGPGGHSHGAGGHKH